MSVQGQSDLSEDRIQQLLRDAEQRLRTSAQTAVSAAGGPSESVSLSNANARYVY